MSSKKPQSHRIMHTSIEDLLLSTVLDSGFFADFQISPQAHAHAFFELLVALHGELQIELQNGERLCIPEGSFCLIQPNVYHSTHSTGNRDQKLALGFQIEKNEKCTGASFYKLCLKGLRSVSASPLLFECNELYDVLQAFKREINSSLPASEALSSALLVQCYVLLFRILCDRSEITESNEEQEDLDGSVSRKVRIESYLYHHSSEQITQEDMAGFLNLSSRQLNRILQQLYGTSFRQLLIDVRLHKAAQLLTSTDLSVEAIATEVGYTSLSGFYSAFRAKFGVSAGKHRRLSQHADTR